MRKTFEGSLLAMSLRIFFTVFSKELPWNSFLENYRNKGFYRIAQDWYETLGKEHLLKDVFMIAQAEFQAKRWKILEQLLLFIFSSCCHISKELFPWSTLTLFSGLSLPILIRNNPQMRHTFMTLMYFWQNTWIKCDRSLFKEPSLWFNSSTKSVLCLVKYPFNTPNLSLTMLESPHLFLGSALSQSPADCIVPSRGYSDISLLDYKKICPLLILHFVPLLANPYNVYFTMLSFI